MCASARWGDGTNIPVDGGFSAAQVFWDLLGNYMADEFIADDIDRAIVQQLRLNGRATNQQIADRLDLTATTVRRASGGWKMTISCASSRCPIFRRMAIMS